MARVPSNVRGDAGSLAAWLVTENALSQFQATTLLKGNPRALLIGPYLLLDFLGKGGMGIVYLARDERNGQECALKVLPRNAAETESQERTIRRFQREIELGHQLRHPAIANAIEAGEQPGLQYLAMQYVLGQTLYRLVRRNGPCTPYWTARWLGEVASALDYAHGKGVYHRDLKPSNIMITPQQSAVLLDFGLARWLDDDHNEEKVVGKRRMVGSFDYIPPEQARNSAGADARSDIYGLGCLAYFALTGSPPFGHVSGRKEKVVCHKEVEPTPLAELRPDLPREFTQVIRRMLAKDPDSRYGNAALVKGTLLDWAEKLSGEDTVGPAPISWHLLPSVDADSPMPVSADKIGKKPKSRKLPSPPKTETEEPEPPVLGDETPPAEEASDFLSSLLVKMRLTRFFKRD